ncbi:MAG: hypothetical protein GSR85_09480 [Desulfurococcales archaeon]|nr:hypothetical protein [Desulfurococcales archaeon]
MARSIKKLDNVIERAKALNNENLASNAIQWKIILMNIIKDSSLVRTSIREGRYILAVEESCRVADKIRNILSYSITSYMPLSAGYRPYIANLLAVLTGICNRDDMNR